MTADLSPIDPEPALESYLQDRQNELSPNTLRSHRSRLTPFVEWCVEEAGLSNLNDLTGRHIPKSDRKMTQYFLRDEAQAVEKDAQRAIEEELGTDVSLIDVREALVLVGAEHLDEVADELRDWGYRLKEE